MSGLPRLVTVAHGTRTPAGNLVAAAITAAASRRMGRLPATPAYVELCGPSVRSVMADNAAPAVVVPLLLSTGHHVRRDLPAAVELSSAPAWLSRPLGPHPLLAEVMCLRLRASGARPGDPVVMVAAGSKDPNAEFDLAAAGRLLQARWGAPVRVARADGRGQSVADLVGEARAGGRVAVAPYLLSPGYFERRTHFFAKAAGATSIAGVIGAHALVAELVVRRYRSVLAASRAAA